MKYFIFYFLELTIAAQQISSEYYFIIYYLELTIFAEYILSAVRIWNYSDFIFYAVYLCIIGSLHICRRLFLVTLDVPLYIYVHTVYE